MVPANQVVTDRLLSETVAGFHAGLPVVSGRCREVQVQNGPAEIDPIQAVLWQDDERSALPCRHHAVQDSPDHVCDHNSHRLAASEARVDVPKTASLKHPCDGVAAGPLPWLPMPNLGDRNKVLDGASAQPEMH